MHVPPQPHIIHFSIKGETRPPRLPRRDDTIVTNRDSLSRRYRQGRRSDESRPISLSSALAFSLLGIAGHPHVFPLPALLPIGPRSCPLAPVRITDDDISRGLDEARGERGQRQRG
jgi:hypothetical protein